ncbi:MAG: DUF2330 domain-containing protein [Actinomycetota bacterium]
MGRRLLLGFAVALGVTLIATPAFACGGLVGPNGAVNLARTTTLAAYHDGVEHYVTAFTFTGATSGQFGSITPLPGIPTKVERGGDWTLQRLEREVAPPVSKGLLFAEAAPAAGGVQVILQTRIDALDITILKGGALAVGKWAEDHGFILPPDAPAVLDFYARRSQIFMAARFDAAAALKRGQRQGDGTPIHLTIPTSNPWVPLRILALGKKSVEEIDADVFLLTDRAPAMLPSPIGSATAGSPIATGLQLVRSERASDSLMHDLSIDKGMGWMPASMWLSYVRVAAPASTLGYDLAIDASGRGKPSLQAAGFPVGLSAAARHIRDSLPMWLAMTAAGAMAGGVLTTLLRRRVRPA